MSRSPLLDLEVEDVPSGDRARERLPDEIQRRQAGGCARRRNGDDGVVENSSPPQALRLHVTRAATSWNLVGLGAVCREQRTAGVDGRFADFGPLDRAAPLTTFDLPDVAVV